MGNEALDASIVVRVPVACRDPRCAVQLAERVVELRDDRPEIVRYGGGGIRNCGLILRLRRFRERFGQQGKCLPVDDRGIGRSCGRRLFGGGAATAARTSRAFRNRCRRMPENQVAN